LNKNDNIWVVYTATLIAKLLFTKYGVQNLNDDDDDDSDDNDDVQIKFRR
jgi:hypothetical protein